MAIKLAEDGAMFGLLHFCPYPERGERVCIGIWWDDGRRLSVEYDEKLRQVRCVAPEFDLNLLRVVLDDLNESLGKVGHSEGQRILRQYGPQFLSTEGRRLLVPLAPDVQARLKKKLLAL